MPATEAIEISMLVTFPGPPPWGSDLRSEAVSARARILGMHAESLLRRRRNSNSGGTRRNYKKEKKKDLRLAPMSCGWRRLFVCLFFVPL